MFRILAYGIPTDATNEYIKIVNSTTIECVKRFCCAIVEIFAGRYLWEPTANDVTRFLYTGEQRGFPGMLGSLDCMHADGRIVQQHGLANTLDVVVHQQLFLRFVADYDLWIWYAYF